MSDFPSCQAADCILPAGHSGKHLSADEQEAQSIRYVDSLRIVPLSSGRFALWTLAGAVAPRIVSELDPEVIREMWRGQREAYEAGKARIVVKPRVQAPGKITIDIDALFGEAKANEI